MTGEHPKYRLKLLIVEDEKVLAMSLKFLIQSHGAHEVLAIADDMASVLKAIEEHRPDLALVDIRLARGASGLDVAATLQSRGIACLFMTGNVPVQPRPDLTLGVLAKPFSDNALFGALEVAGKILHGEAPAPTELPPELKLY